jgi:hypothetical protein
LHASLKPLAPELTASNGGSCRSTATPPKAASIFAWLADDA